MTDPFQDKSPAWLQQRFNELVGAHEPLRGPAPTEEEREELRKMQHAIFSRRGPKLTELPQVLDGNMEQQLLDAGGGLEVRAWLEKSKIDGAPRGFAGGTGNLDSAVGSDAGALVQKFYDLGASRVAVLEEPRARPDADELTVDRLLIELPANRAARKAIFALRRELSHYQFHLSPPNMGQKYLLLIWD